MNYKRIALRVSNKEFSKLIELGNRIVSFMTGNANFANASPPLQTVQTAIDQTVAALAQWGEEGNRGSHDDYTDLCNKSLTLHNMLKSEANYVENTAANAAGNDYSAMEVIITGSGFALGREKSPIGLLEEVQNFRNTRSKSVNANQIEMRWKRPLNTRSPKDIGSYEVWRSTSPDFNTAVQIATTTRTVYIDTNEQSSPVTYYYWIVPVNTEGPGAVSDLLSALLAAGA